MRSHSRKLENLDVHVSPPSERRRVFDLPNLRCKERVAINQPTNHEAGGSMWNFD